MAPTRSCGIHTYTMSAQLNNRNSKRPGFYASSSKPIYEERLLGTEKIQLLKAPGIDSEVMWKQQCFESVYNRLRSKLSESCNADSIIAVFNTHFPISTLSAEDQARTTVTKFKSAFGNILYLKPTAFLNRNGDDVTSKMDQTPRPANVCHLGVLAEISMYEISRAFDQEMTFTVNYFLPLPQSYGKNKYSVPRYPLSPSKSKPPTLGSAEALDANVFSPPLKSSASVNLNKGVLQMEDTYVTPKAAKKDPSAVNLNISDNEAASDIDSEEGLRPQVRSLILVMLSKCPLLEKMLIYNNYFLPAQKAPTLLWKIR